jgi:hypothetical protein
LKFQESLCLPAQLLARSDGAVNGERDGPAAARWCVRAYSDQPIIVSKRRESVIVAELTNPRFIVVGLLVSPKRSVGG